MKTLCLLLMLAVLVVAAAPVAAFTGSLSSSNSEINGTGFWVNQSLLPPAEQPNWIPATINWTVTQNINQSWHFDYVLSVYRAEVSHFVLETSQSFTNQDIFNLQGHSGAVNVGWHNVGPGNPSIPSNVYGIKFDSTVGTNLHVSFDSWRAPVWGDFYSKCGNVGGTQNTAWNAGFSTTDTDPISPAANGSLLNHILVPDTTVVPEPGSMMALGAGIIAMLASTRRRERR